jgi:hypothetical protein
VRVQKYDGYDESGSGRIRLDVVGKSYILVCESKKSHATTLDGPMSLHVIVVALEEDNVATKVKPHDTC